LTSDDLDRVERQLAIRLPAAYRALIQADPVALGASGPDDQLIDDAERLIALNRRLRDRGLSGQTWPAHFFAFGGDGSGNAYYFDLRRDPSPIGVADHVDSEYREQWPSLDAWLAERIRAAHRAARPWWKFWVVLAASAAAVSASPVPGT
jgi:hypothetical protein